MTRYFAYSPGRPGAIKGHIRAEEALELEQADWFEDNRDASYPGHIVKWSTVEQTLTREQLEAFADGRRALRRWEAKDDSLFEAWEHAEQMSGCRRELQRMAERGCTWSAKALSADDEAEIVRLSQEHGGTCAHTQCGGRSEFSTGGLASV